MKVQELIDYVNSNEFHSVYEFEDSLTKEQFKELKIVSESIDVDRHRWYEVSTTVYKLEDGFVGVRGVSNIYAEDMDVEDCCIKCSASEYIEIPSVIYKKK